MQMYETIDGTLIGFYRERGGEVKPVMFRDVYEKRLVAKTREEEITTEGFFKIVVTTVPEHWEEKPVFTPGHYERKMVWHDEYSVTRYREVPGHYEIQNIWAPEYYVTRYYWREAHPARGLEAAWIPYQDLIPAGFKDQRVWVDTFIEEYQELMPAGEKETRVWVDDDYITEKIWLPEQKTSEQVWVPAVKELVTVEYQELENVLVGREAVYGYVDESLVRLFEVVELIPNVVDVPDYKDVIVIRNAMTGELLKTTAKYLGLGTRIADNEYVVP